MDIVWMILFILVGLLMGAVIAVANRRFDAVIRAREDYDEDVDGKMTKKQKEAFEARKAAEAKLTRMPVGEVVKERPGRFAACLILAGGGAAAIAAVYGVNAATWTLLAFTVLLILISMIDLDTMEIPFLLNVVILVLGGISILTFQGTSPFADITIVNRLVGMVVIAVPMILINLIIADAFGGGDIKLLVAAGFLLGWKMTVIGFFVGAIIAGAIGVTLMARKKKGGKEHIPFGPSLCAGLYLSVLFGTQMMDWYIQILKNSMGQA